MPLPNNIASATITLYKINEVSIYKSELISSNGTIFHPYDYISRYLSDDSHASIYPTH